MKLESMQIETTNNNQYRMDDTRSSDNERSEPHHVAVAAPAHSIGAIVTTNKFITDLRKSAATSLGGLIHTIKKSASL